MDGRWVLVAGGSGGIGQAIARALADDGWDVAVGYHHGAAAADEVVNEIAQTGRRARTIQIDLADAAASAAAVAGLAAEVPLSGVVYAAGPHIPMRYISDIDAATFSEILDQDAKACFHLLLPALRPLRATGGAVLALTTTALKRYAKRDMLSIAPKAVVQELVKGIAVEEGRYGIRANCVNVGLLEGEGMWTELLERGDYSDEMLAVAKHNIPLQRFGDVADVAEAARFLLSDRAGWITGQTLSVDGGYAI